jgi:hypothetical protein
MKNASECLQTQMDLQSDVQIALLFLIILNMLPFPGLPKFPTAQQWSLVQMNFLYGLKKYWKRVDQLLLCLLSCPSLLFASHSCEGESLCVEGILFQAEMQCAMVAPARRIKVPVKQQLFFFPDSLIRVSGQYPALLWVDKDAALSSHIGKHVKATGTTREFFSGEFLFHIEQILECAPTPKEPKAKNVTEEEIDYWEEEIPRMASAAFLQEGYRVLLKGFDVVLAHDDALWTVHPDGTETFIKELPPHVRVDSTPIILP